MAEADEARLVDEGTLPPDDFHHAIERIGEIAKYQLEVPADLAGLVTRELGDVVVDIGTVEAAVSAVLAGHLVLQGPPGTGKSTLARALCRAFNTTILPVTAHQEWSTFEVIGRQELRVTPDGDEEIVPVNGFFTEAVIKCAGSIVQHFDEPTLPQATWLLIDEFNRAHIDKAFGELFTILGTDETVPIVLSHQSEGNRQLVTPRRFRIVATLNSVDRQFVNNLGQGLKRRFSFVTVGIPPRRPEGHDWNGDEDVPAQREFKMVIRRAADRAARKVVDEDQVPAKVTEFSAFLGGPALDRLRNLFSLIETVRYAKRDDNQPHVPVGSAQLIDAVELFLLRLHAAGLNQALIGDALDWAAAVKLAPLFDADNVTQPALEAFVGGLGAPFTGAFRKELREILAAGQYFVE
jgi:5-methylcytosine-specific restriction protein B